MFDIVEAISVLAAKGATQESNTLFMWHLGDAVTFLVQKEKWIAKIRLTAVPTDNLEMTDRWAAEGYTVQSLKHFLRLWTEPTRPVPGSYGT